MWILVGVLVFLALFYFIRYELPNLIARRQLRKLDRRVLMLTGHVHAGVSRHGKPNEKLIL